MSLRRIVQVISLVVLALATSAAADNRMIVRATASTVGNIAARHGLNVAQVLDGQNQTTYLLTGRPGVASADLETELEADTDVLACESDGPVALPEAPAGMNQATANATSTPPPPSAVSYFGTPVLNAYLSQPATSIIRLWDAQSTFRLTGAGIVAVIDTGVDPSHPVLQNALVPGYDFVNNVAGTASEWVDLSQSTTALLDQSTTALLDASQIVVLNQSTTALLDQSTTALLDTTQVPQAFGHGTMVAGIVHLTAPTAQIMPLKAFSGNGTGNLSDVVRAIYFATQNGAKVINMSFSMASTSVELQRAINSAIQHGVICVASAGNTGQQVMLYPAALFGVVGVGSTSNLDQRSTFSTYNATVDLGAPGEGIITTYPGQHWAAGWGTSFSTPFVSGGAALLIQAHRDAEMSNIVGALGHAKSVSGMGKGRIDLYQALGSLN